MLSIEDFSMEQKEIIQKIDTGQISVNWTFDDYIWTSYNQLRKVSPHAGASVTLVPAAVRKQQ
jgi:hypothetical protein